MQDFLANDKDFGTRNVCVLEGGEPGGKRKEGGCRVFGEYVNGVVIRLRGGFLWVAFCLLTKRWWWRFRT